MNGCTYFRSHVWTQKEPGLWPYYGQLCECGNACFAHPKAKVRATKREDG